MFTFINTCSFGSKTLEPPLYSMEHRGVTMEGEGDSNGVPAITDNSTSDLSSKLKLFTGIQDLKEFFQYFNFKRVKFGTQVFISLDSGGVAPWSYPCIPWSTYQGSTMELPLYTLEYPLYSIHIQGGKNVALFFSYFDTFPYYTMEYRGYSKVYRGSSMVLPK